MSPWIPQDVPAYPPVRYREEQPEASAWFRRADAPPDYEAHSPDKHNYLATDVRYHYVAGQQQTDGDYSLYRVDLGPNAGGPAPHFHRTMSEAFFVLSGTVKFYDGNQWTDGTRNDYLYVPPGGSHGWHNDSDQPASMLVLFAPGVPRDSFFEGLTQLDKLSEDQRREWFVRHDNQYIE